MIQLTDSNKSPIDEISLHPCSSLPICQQIAQEIELLIAEGKLVEGDKLPPVRKLAERLRINFNTVSRAYRLLIKAGLMHTRRGGGSYIRLDATRRKSIDMRKDCLELLAQRYLNDARRLGYDRGEAIKSLAGLEIPLSHSQSQ